MNTSVDQANKDRINSLQLFTDKFFELSLDCIMITDSDCNIITVNPAFTLVTGYQASEVIGKKSNVLRSGIHSNEFYQFMWASIEQKGSWQGEITNRKKNGCLFTEWLSIVYIDDDGGCYVGMFSDISARKTIEAGIYQLAYFDDLTRLPNRRMLKESFKKAIDVKKTTELLAILFLDVDLFKQINDDFGHQIGDDLLRLVAHRLRNSIQKTDTVCRFGGDEFVLLLEGVNSRAGLESAVSRITKVLDRPYEINNQKIYVSSSIGISQYPDDGETLNTLLKHADAAMYRAKRMHQCSFEFFQPSLIKETISRTVIMEALSTALVNNELKICFELMVNLSKNSISGMEAILHWDNKTIGNLAVEKFREMSAELGLSVNHDLWLLIEACKQRYQWFENGIDCGCISVKISSKHFNHDLALSINTALKQTRLPAHLLEIEIAEEYFTSDFERALLMLNKVSELGVVIALDNFGHGISSLKNLWLLPLNTIKISSSIIDKIPNDESYCRIAQTIIDMSNSLGIKPVAQGVKHNNQFDFFKQNDCDIQLKGFLGDKGNFTEIEKSMTQFYQMI